jgi:hypothetical protein
VNAFLNRAGQILEVAAAGREYGAGAMAIVVDRQGGLRMVDPTGWSLAALAAEYSAAAVYRIERRHGTVRVEGWDGADRCLLQRGTTAGAFMQAPRYPAIRQCAAAVRLPGMVCG